MTQDTHKHCDEQTLILFHYGEIETEPIEQHLARCQACADEYDSLRRVFQAADNIVVPEPGAEYEQQLWRKVRPPVVDTPGTPWWAWFTVPRMAVAASFAVMLVAAFLLGRGTGRPGEPIPQQTRERILFVAVGDHLERSQRMLVELIRTEPGASVDISAQQATAQRLASDNRLYRRTAKAHGDQQIADVLEQLERLLLEIANGPSQLARQELSSLRRQVERQGLLMKIRVLEDTTRPRATPGNPTLPAV